MTVIPNIKFIPKLRIPIVLGVFFIFIKLGMTSSHDNTEFMEEDTGGTSLFMRPNLGPNDDEGMFFSLDQMNKLKDIYIENEASKAASQIQLEKITKQNDELREENEQLKREITKTHSKLVTNRQLDDSNREFLSNYILRLESELKQLPSLQRQTQVQANKLTIIQNQLDEERDTNLKLQEEKCNIEYMAFKQKQKLDQFEKQQKSLTEEITTLQEKCDEAQLNQDNAKKSAQANRDKCKDLEKELRSLQTKERGDQSRIHTLTETINRLSKMIDSLTKENQELLTALNSEIHKTALGDKSSMDLVNQDESLIDPSHTFSEMNAEKFSRVLQIQKEKLVRTKQAFLSERLLNAAQEEDIKRREEELRHTQEELTHSKRILEEQQKLSSTQDKKLRRLNSRFQTQINEIKQLNENLNTKSTELEETTSTLRHNENELAQVRNDLQTRNQELEQARSALRAKEHKLQTQMQKLKKKRADLRSREHDLDQVRRDLQTFNQNLAQARTALQTNEYTLKTRDQELVQARSELQEKELTLQKTNQKLMQSRATLQAKAHELQTRDQELVQAKTELHANAQDLQMRDQELTQARSESQEKEHHLQTQTQELEKKCAELKSREHDLDQLREDLQAINQSLTQARTELQTSVHKLHKSNEELDQTRVTLLSSQDINNRQVEELHQSKAVYHAQLKINSEQAKQITVLSQKLQDHQQLIQVQQEQLAAPASFFLSQNQPTENQGNNGIQIINGFVVTQTAWTWPEQDQKPQHVPLTPVAFFEQIKIPSNSLLSYTSLIFSENNTSSTQKATMVKDSYYWLKRLLEEKHKRVQSEAEINHLRQINSRLRKELKNVQILNMRYKDENLKLMKEKQKIHRYLKRSLPTLNEKNTNQNKTPTKQEKLDLFHRFMTMEIDVAT